MKVYVHGIESEGGRKAGPFFRNLKRLLPYVDLTFVKTRWGANFRLFIFPERDPFVETSHHGSMIRLLDCSFRSSHYPDYALRMSWIRVFRSPESRMFLPCIYEETLQALGPINDDRHLELSAFNDTTRYRRVQFFDLMIVNMLYHPDVKAGMLREEVLPLLPGIVRDVRKRLAPLADAASGSFF